jgi:anti-sigma B factor antagonist
MAHDELSIDVRKQDGELVVFKLRGSFDLATSPTVRVALAEELEKGKPDLLLDLTELEFLDSTGLGALIGAHRRAVERGGSVRMIVRDGPILRLLNITGLIRVFAVFHSLEDARENRDRVAPAI